ncbi:hypothetical protein HOL59_03775 [Candidatus Woesearchaeota archaeon]|nr:hypothetical protein [Candidatus Woesearchaeota archaeon]
MDDKFIHKVSKKDILKFINEYLYVDGKAANAIYQFFYEQYHFSEIPSHKKIVIEKYSDRGMNYVIFNTLFGRRVNDCLSRALGFAIGRSQHRDVEIGITDNGFYMASEKIFNALRAFELLKSEDFRATLENAIERSEVLSRRFRHCAARSLMMLRSYMGRKKSAGRMQVNSRILFNAVKRIGNDFPILKEARREVLEDLMDYKNAQLIIDGIVDGKISLVETNNLMPSPFSFGLIVGGYSDVIKIEDKQEFLKRMHQMVLAKIALKDGKKLIKEKKEEFSYTGFWDEQKKQQEDRKDTFQEKLKMQIWNLKRVPVYMKEELVKLVETGNMQKKIWDEIEIYQEDVEKDWPDELKEFVGKKK